MARKSPGQSEVYGSCAHHPTPHPSFPHHRADPGPWTIGSGEKGSMMSFPVRTARSCTRKSAREPPSPSRRPLPGMRRTRSSFEIVT